MEKILSITEFSNHTAPGKSKWREFDGFNITTSEQVVFMGISNGQSCCESWGYFLSHDDFSEFIGADLISVEVVDTALNISQVADLQDDESSIMFVNINTSNGLLQFVAHNTHNGYYGHEALVISNQLTHEEGL